MRLRGACKRGWESLVPTVHPEAHGGQAALSKVPPPSTAGTNGTQTQHTENAALWRLLSTRYQEHRRGLTEDPGGRGTLGEGMVIRVHLVPGLLGA